MAWPLGAPGAGASLPGDRALSAAGPEEDEAGEPDPPPVAAAPLPAELEEGAPAVVSLPPPPLLVLLPLLLVVVVVVVVVEPALVESLEEKLRGQFRFYPVRTNIDKILAGLE